MPTAELGRGSKKKKIPCDLEENNQTFKKLENLIKLAYNKAASTNYKHSHEMAIREV